MKRDLKFINTSYLNYMMEVGYKLTERYNWKPVYWFVDDITGPLIKSKFPDAITHDCYQGIKGIFPEQLSNMEMGVVDENLLNEMAVCESISLNMMERNDSTNSFSHQERLRHYHSLLKYWLGVLDLLSPDVILFEEEPHAAFDYVLYCLAKKRGIQIILFVRTNFQARMFPVNVFENGSGIIKSEYQKKLSNLGNSIIRNFDFADDIKTFVKKAQSNDHELLLQQQFYDQLDRFYEIRNKKRIDAIKGKLKRLSPYLNLFSLMGKISRLPDTLSHLFKVYPYSDQKKKNKSFKESRFRNLDILLTIRKTLKSKMSLKKYYETLQTNHPDLQQPYILCALAYQPEKTTSPMAEHFVNQLLMIELVRKAMPPHWKLYVKEHPCQFTWFLIYGEQYRSAEYYDRIKALPNTELIPIFYNTFPLVDNCKAIATTTGSIGFEAVLRNKPVLTFGYPWFQYCEGIFESGDYTELQKQIKKIENGYIPDQHKVNLFIETIQENSYEGVVGGQTYQKFCGEKGLPEKNSEEHLKAIITLMDYNEKYQNNS